MKNSNSEALRAARKARLAGKTSTPGTAAKPIAQVKKVVTTPKSKKAENEVLTVQTDDQQHLPEGKAEKSVPIQPPPPGGAAAPAGAVMAPDGAAAPGEEVLEVAVEAPGGEMPPAAAEGAETPAEEKAEEATEDEDDEMVEAYVVDPAFIPANAHIRCVGPFMKEKDAHWIVLADGEPLAKIALSDQTYDGTDNPSFRKSFVSEAFGQSFASAATKKPIQQLLASCHGRPYAAAVRATKAYAEIAVKAEAAAKATVQKSAAKFRDDFLSMLGLVAEAQRTNFMPENPLKEALFRSAKRAGVNDPTALIEAAFNEASTQHFEVMANKAVRWMDFSADALADIKETLAGSATTARPRLYEASVETAPAIPQQRPVASSRANVPIVATRVAAVQTDEKEIVRERFSFRTRMHDRSIPSKG